MLKAIWQSIKDFKLDRKLTEPIRRTANVISIWAVAVAGVLAWAQQHVSFVPDKYRDRVTAGLAATGVVVAFVVRASAEVLRMKVFSPATHVAELAQASEASYRTQVQQGTVVDAEAVKAAVAAQSVAVDPEALPKVDENGDLA